MPKAPRNPASLPVYKVVRVSRVTITQEARPSRSKLTRPTSLLTNRVWKASKVMVRELLTSKRRRVITPRVNRKVFQIRGHLLQLKVSDLTEEEPRARNMSAREAVKIHQWRSVLPHMSKALRTKSITWPRNLKVFLNVIPIIRLMRVHCQWVLKSNLKVKKMTQFQIEV